MNGQVIILKIKQRLNKIDSSDYDNIEAWALVEAFNKAQTDWCRRNLHGLNATKEGDESSTRRIDDLQVLLKSSPVLMINMGDYYETHSLPVDYMQWKRISAKAKSDCCPEPRNLVIYQAEEGNLDILLKDKNKQPNFEWGETFSAIKGNKIAIYTNGEFDIVKPILTYYAEPPHIEITGVPDPFTGVTPTTNIDSIFKDDLVELFIDEAVKILSGDIESLNQVQREGQQVESNN